MRATSLAALTGVAVSLAAAIVVTPAVASPIVASVSKAEKAAPSSNLTFTAHNLGAGGGRYSAAEAVSGSVVVGWLRTAAGDFHAFAYDLAAEDPVMRDLGTLGGSDSEALAVDGTVVVGWSETAAGERHAFAYDLAADAPVMRDLGTLGGRGSRAVAVAGTVVVGWAETATGALRAFAYDLGDAEPAMLDLGTLGGPASEATAIDGSIVVGVATTALHNSVYGYEDNAHAFAYDLAADDPEMTDLTPQATSSKATDVHGDVVVGWSSSHGSAGSAFAYDLAADDAAMRDLGILEGHNSSSAIDVEDGVVVGVSDPTGGYHPSAFAFDLTAPEAGMRDFSTLGNAKSRSTAVDGDVVVGGWVREWSRSRHGGHAFAHDLDAKEPRSLVLGSWRGSEVEDIDGNVVVGAKRYGSQSLYATAWVLRETSRPMLAFRRFDRQVKEGVGRVKVVVERYGRTDRAVSVRYRTRSGTATAGKDFVSTSGELRFSAGTTRRSFTVKVLNDRRAETGENILLTLSRPSGTALLGSTPWTEVRITKNDR